MLEDTLKVEKLRKSYSFFNLRLALVKFLKLYEQNGEITFILIKYMNIKTIDFLTEFNMKKLL